MAARFAVARRFFRSGQSADEIPVAERVAFRGSVAARCGFMTRHLRHAYARLAGYPDNMRRHLLPLIAIFATLPSWGGVANFKVTTDQSVDASSLETLVQGVVARSGAKTNDAKAVAIYEWLHQAIFHWAYATEPEPQTVGPLKLLHVYGWGLCGGQHTVLKALFETAGWECRYVGWSDPGHTTIEVKYDGRWHYFDVFLKCYFWSKDRSHVVSQEEIAADPSLVLDAVKDGRAAREHLCCGDPAAGIVSGVKSRKVVGDSKGWASVTWRDESYAPSLALPCGASLRLEWAAAEKGFVVGKAPQHSCGTKDFRENPVLGPLLEHYGPRNWSNGRLTYAPDFSQPADVADIELTNAKAAAGKLIASGNATAIFRLPLPYAYVSANVQASFAGGGKLSFSTDGGRTWKPCDAAPIVRQKYDVCFKAEFTGAMEKIRVEALVEHNRGVLPYLVAGKNRVAASCEAKPGAIASISLGWQDATAANPKRKQWNGTGITYGTAQTATRDLDGGALNFDLEASGNTAPKMLFIERAVRARR